MKNFLLISVLILTLISCKKDQEKDFVFEPTLTHTFTVEMDTFSGSNYTANAFSLNMRDLATIALASSEYKNFNTLEIEGVEILNVRVSSIVTSYSNMDQLDSLRFTVNSNTLLHQANNFSGGFSSAFYQSNVFAFTNTLDRPSFGGPEEGFVLELLPKATANTAKNYYELEFQFIPRITGEYLKD